MVKGNWIAHYGMILLACNCERRFPKPWPELLDELWCPKHGNTYVTRTPNTSGNYSFKCECGYAKSFGSDHAFMERKAGEHFSKHPSKRIALMDGSRIYKLLKPGDYL